MFLFVIVSSVARSFLVGSPTLLLLFCCRGGCPAINTKRCTSCCRRAKVADCGVFAGSKLRFCVCSLRVCATCPVNVVAWLRLVSYTYLAEVVLIIYSGSKGQTTLVGARTRCICIMVGRLRRQLVWLR